MRQSSCSSSKQGPYLIVALKFCQFYCRMPKILYMLKMLLRKKNFLDMAQKDHFQMIFTVTFSCQKIISEKVLECKKQVLSPRNRCHPAAYRWYRPCTGSIDGVASKRLFVVSMQCNCFIVFELTPWQL